jgi:hypothetical protein
MKTVHGVSTHTRVQQQKGSPGRHQAHTSSQAWIYLLQEIRVIERNQLRIQQDRNVSSC